MNVFESGQLLEEDHRETEESPLLKILKTRLDKHMNNLI